MCAKTSVRFGVIETRSGCQSSRKWFQVGKKEGEEVGPANHFNGHALVPTGLIYTEHNLGRCATTLHSASGYAIHIPRVEPTMAF